MISKTELVKQGKTLTFRSKNYEDFLAIAPKETLMGLDDIGLILIAPETFYMGIVGDVLFALQKRGINFLKVSVVEAYSKEVVGRHLPSRIANEFRWWLIEQRYACTPTCALLVTLDRKPKVSIYDELTRIKGYRIPYKASKTSLRATLPSINGLLNLLHSSDDSASLLRDADPYFSVEEIIDAIDRRKDFRLGIEDIKHCYLYGYLKPKKEIITFFQVLFRVIYRITSKIVQHTKKESDRYKLVNFQKAIRAAITMSKNSKNRWEESQKAYESLVDIRRQLKNINTFDGTISHANFYPDDTYVVKLLWDIVNRLISFNKSIGFDWTKLFSYLFAYGIVVEKWENFILVSTLLNIHEEFPEKFFR